ncbi:uncharacterized protein N7469_010844 [Penicillium citrinum]|uniref:Thioredoxin-like fold domain-containing protein n=1 Tax=Penicillium citrinum TaxID=5077 RepID=A0A9W9TGG8_PENCI|nr:uncharacterized protein N7469_010844 [Penicillium citrinum]KAJ5221957.1 hypothetical protein N7469_010844 [Penicillium citrinum]
MSTMDTPSNITIFRGFPEKGCYTWSPFVTKLEARLRFGGISYNVESGSPMKVPRGKVPYITFDDDGQLQSLADSDLIAQDLSIKALLENRLYFLQGYERWIENYYTMRAKILGGMSWPLQVVVGNIIYNINVRTMQGQGTGTFFPEEIAAFRAEIWESLNAILSASYTQHRDSEGPFWRWGEDAPTETDGVVFGFIISGLICSAGPTTKQILDGYPTLVAYARRIHDKYFPDYKVWE